jgi:hypothetical protein
MRCKLETRRKEQEAQIHRFEGRSVGECRVAVSNVA